MGVGVLLGALGLKVIGKSVGTGMIGCSVGEVVGKALEPVVGFEVGTPLGPAVVGALLGETRGPVRFIVAGVDVGSLWSTKDTSSSSILESDYLLDLLTSTSSLRRRYLVNMSYLEDVMYCTVTVSLLDIIICPDV